jgi:cell shape-determining protein MreC
MEENDNTIPEITAANPDGGAENLNADPISPATHESIDFLLDEAERETGVESTPEPEPEPTTTHEDNSSLEDLGNEPDSAPVEPSVEPLAQLESVDRTAQPEVQIDPEILAIEQPRNLSEKNQNNWRKLQETASLYKAQASEAETLRQRLAEAEQRPTQTPQDYEELKRFKDIFDIKNSPRFQSKYSQPIESTKQAIYDTMKKHGASEDVIASIEKAGGPDKIDEAWWKQTIDKLPMFDGGDLADNLRSINKLKTQQEGEIAYAAEHGEEILAQRQNESREWYQKETTQIDNYVDNLTKEVPWARYKQFTGNESSEQAEQIKAHNNNVADLHQKFNSALWPQTAEERASVAAAAVLSHQLTTQLREEQSQKANMEATIKRLTEENSRIKASGKMPKSNISSQVAAKSDINSRIKMNASDAIDLGLDEAGL